MKRALLFFFLIIVTNLSSQTKTKCNCCTEKHAEFDFWIGTWNVTNTDGTAAGKNIIKKVQDNCILQENWTSASLGYTGTSNNFYNWQKKQWEQIWVDNQGQSLHLKGNKVGNQMILSSDELTNKKGDKYINRVTWTYNEDETVRQLWEIVQEGKVKTVAFDGLYKKE